MTKFTFERRPDEDLIRRRQQARARVMAILLVLFVLLTFAISIVKIAQGHK